MFDSLISCGADVTLRGAWDESLIVLSFLAAIGGSFAGLDCADRMRAASNPAQRRRYFVAGATLIGVSIWTMHFVGMLAHRLDVPVSYDPVLGGVSIVAAAFGAGLAFLIVNQPVVTRTHVVFGGIAMGLAIATMHYLGMASMQMPAKIQYIPALFAASVGLAIVASTGALWLAQRPLVPGATGHWIKASSAVLLGGAIAGMHYTGMAAACYIPAPMRVAQETAVGFWSLKDLLLASGLVIAGALLALAAKSSADRQLALESLEVQRQQAVDALQAKDIFLASLSHELRTPLNPALLIAADGANNPAFSPPAREAFAAIERQITFEAKLIDDLLDLTRNSRGTLRLEKRLTDIHKILQRSIASLQLEFEAKHLTLTRDLAADRHCAIADVGRMHQVFCNLLQNAVKYTPMGGTITVSTGNDDSTLEIRISDNGLGLTPAEQEHCFEQFAQGDHQLGGLGLGLTVSKGIVDQHDGSISVTSAGRGQGSQFLVKLPAVADPVSAGADVRTLGSSLPAYPGQSVLLVEDHEASRAAVETLLRKRGYAVTAVGTVRDAVAAGTSTRFGILISDLGLPDGDGCALIQTLGKHAPAVKIAVTGYGGFAADHRRRFPGAPDQARHTRETRCRAGCRRGFELTARATIRPPARAQGLPARGGAHGTSATWRPASRRQRRCRCGDSVRGGPTGPRTPAGRRGSSRRPRPAAAARS
jgi:signal transduction histidine kinase/CheY-like chemotaxis protein